MRDVITITIIDFLYMRSLISMLSDWVLFLAYNLFGIKGFVVVEIWEMSLLFAYQQCWTPFIKIEKLKTA
jgi:hypothetical protein